MCVPTCVLIHMHLGVETGGQSWSRASCFLRSCAYLVWCILVFYSHNKRPRTRKLIKGRVYLRESTPSPWQQVSAGRHADSSGWELIVFSGESGKGTQLLRTVSAPATYFLQQGHTYTYPNNSTNWAEYSNGQDYGNISFKPPQPDSQHAQGCPVSTDIVSGLQANTAGPTTSSSFSEVPQRPVTTK